MAKKGPTRRCIACGTRSAKSELLRFVWRDGEIAWDRKHRLLGRGAYVHRWPACWSKISDLSRWERAFRLSRGALKLAELDRARSEAYAEIRKVEPPKGGRSGVGKLRL